MLVDPQTARYVNADISRLIHLLESGHSARVLEGAPLLARIDNELDWKAALVAAAVGMELHADNDAVVEAVCWGLIWSIRHAPYRGEAVAALLEDAPLSPLMRRDLEAVLAWAVEEIKRYEVLVDMSVMLVRLPHNMYVRNGRLWIDDEA